MRRLRYSLVPALVLVLGACSSGSSSSKATSTTTVPAAKAAADLKLAQGVVLTDSDAPAGYSPKAHTDSSDMPEPLKRDFANCVGASVTLFDNKGQHANGPDLDNEAGTEITNEAEVYPTKSELDSAFNAMTGSKVNGCITKMFASYLKSSVAKDAPGMTLGEVTVDSFPVEGIGDRGLGLRLTVPVTANGQTVTVVSDVASAQRGRALLTINATGSGTPPSRDLEKQLLTKMNQRLGTTTP